MLCLYRHFVYYANTTATRLGFHAIRRCPLHALIAAWLRAWLFFAAIPVPVNEACLAGYWVEIRTFVKFVEDSFSDAGHR